MTDWKDKKYDIILADPCWYYNKRSGKTKFGKGAGLHYDMLKNEEICSLNIKRIANDRSMLFLWVTCPELMDGGRMVMESWGYTYKTVAFAWVKQNPKSNTIFTGPGFYTASNIELVLLGTKGRPFSPEEKLVEQVLISPRSRHSEKPDEIHKRIERMYPNLNKVELFARREYPGWDCLGLELGHDFREL